MSKFHLLFLFAVAVAGFGQVALKKAAMQPGRTLLRQYANGYVLLGYFLMLSSMGIASIAYRGMPLKAGPAFDSLGFIFVPIMGRVFFLEEITRTKGLGFLLIMIGVMIFVL